MGPLGVPEMLFILVLVLLIFGPKRLPEVGRMVGKGLGEFRRASNELKRSIQTELALEDLEDPPRRRPLPPLPPRPQPVRTDPEDGGEDAAAAPPAETVAQQPLQPAVEETEHGLVNYPPPEAPVADETPAPPAASPLVPK